MRMPSPRIRFVHLSHSIHSDMYSGHELLWYVQERHAVAVPSSGRTRTLPRRRRRRVYSILISATVGVGRDLRRVCLESQSAKQWNPELAAPGPVPAPRPRGPGPAGSADGADNRFANVERRRLGVP
jgi:hypothetical protein